MTVRLGSRYELHEVLGRGGSGEVWSATSPDGPVAVKVLRPELSTDAQIVDRFVAERSLLIGLKSPHIVGVRDLVIEGDRLGIVMDLVTGGDLRTRIRDEKTLRPSEAIDTMMQVLDGLAAVHAAGVVHRDLKPENILLEAGDGTNRVRVADFGIARLSSATRATRTTGLLGTPRYVAPELAIRGRVSPAVDIYAAGVTLYEMLFGRVPFDGPHPAAVLRAHTEDAPYRPANVDEALWDVVVQMLEKNPSDRPTATEAAARLQALTPTIASMDAFPALERSGGPDTDDTSTTDPHGNLTDLNGIGRRRSLGATMDPLPQPTRGRRWLIPMGAVAVLIALVAALAILRSPDPKPPTAFGFDDASQGALNVHHTWKFASSHGDELDGTMTVSTRTGRPFVNRTSALAVFPPPLSRVKFVEHAKATSMHAPSVGKAAAVSTTVMQLPVANGEVAQAFHYTVKVPRLGNGIDRLDQWSYAMRAAAATLCTSGNAPKVCDIADHLIAITFSIPSAPPIGPLQTFDASTTLQGRNKGGSLVAPGHVSGAHFRSSDPSKASVNKETGVVTGVTAGTALITARVGDLTTGALMIEVSPTSVPVVTKLSIEGPTDIRNGVAANGPQKGQIPRYAVHAQAQDGSEPTVPVVWTVEDTGVGSMNGDGSFTPDLAPGTAAKTNLRAEYVNAVGRRLSASLKITVSGSSSTVIDDRCLASPVPADCGRTTTTSVSSTTSTSTSPSTSTTSSGPSPLPDLVVSDFSWDSPVSGQCIRFHARITNQGAGPTPGGVHLGILFTIDKGTSNDHIWWEDNAAAPMPAGSFLDVTSNKGTKGSCSIDHSAWLTTPGTHSVQAWVDDISGDHPQIAESSEDNNIPAVKTFTVG